MRITFTDTFKRDYKELPQNVKRRANKALQFLATDLSHPSLRAKKIRSREDIWEASITKSYRLSFQVRGDMCVLRRTGKHEELLKRP
ncbi:type II toxin-antitoxin system mRNA interferase toxin, RelE/StbE family [Candidatus Aerophobetes bacterium]|nr:type II toxin-antitoxin system mRNA interferase toxin, RelE/StbE family [Candidatus Aerophobetes bacterium]